MIDKDKIDDKNDPHRQMLKFLMFDIEDEYKTIRNYDKQIPLIIDEKVKKIIEHIRDEEMGHVGKLTYLIDYLSEYDGSVRKDGYDNAEKSKLQTFSIKENIQVSAKRLGNKFKGYGIGKYVQSKTGSKRLGQMTGNFTEKLLNKKDDIVRKFDKNGNNSKQSFKKLSNDDNRQQNSY